MATNDRERAILLAALDAAQEREKAADARTQAALRRAHHLEQQLEKAHRLIAAQTRRINTMRPTTEVAA